MPGHGSPDAEPDDGRLGDRRVPDPIPEAVAQAAGQAEDIPAFADVDAGEEDPLVRLELHFERAADRIHGPEDRGVGRKRRRFGSGGPFAVTKSNSVVTEGAANPRARSTASSSCASTEDSSASISDASIPSATSRARCTTMRIALLPLVQLLLGSVALRIALVVPVPAVGGRFHQHGPASRPRRHDHVLHARGRRDDVVAVDGHVGECVALGPALE